MSVRRVAAGGKPSKNQVTGTASAQGENIKPARRDAGGGGFVFLDLRKRNTKDAGKRLDRDADPFAGLPQPRAGTDVDEAKFSFGIAGAVRHKM